MAETPMMPPMMKCGCRGMALHRLSDGTQEPYCIIHDCNELGTEPDVTGRYAKCGLCGEIVPSRTTLFFFSYQPEEEYDAYCCSDCA